MRACVSVAVLSLALVSLLGCQSLPPIDWAEVEQATTFAREKLPAIVSWLQEEGWLEAPDTENASLRGLFLNVTIRVANHYLIEQERLPTWEELQQEVVAYLEYLWTLPEGAEDQYDGLAE